MARPRSDDSLTELMKAEEAVQSARKRHHARLIQAIEEEGLDRMPIPEFQSLLREVVRQRSGGEVKPKSRSSIPSPPPGLIPQPASSPSDPAAVPVAA